MTHATTQVNLKDIMLSEIAYHKKTNTVSLHLHEIPRVVQLIETESRIAVARN